MSSRSVEIDSLADLDARAGAGERRCAGWFVSSLDLRDRTDALLRVDPRGAVFLGCRFADEPGRRRRTAAGRRRAALPGAARRALRPVPARCSTPPRSSTGSSTGGDRRTPRARTRPSTAGPGRPAGRTPDLRPGGDPARPQRHRRPRRRRPSGSTRPGSSASWAATRCGAGDPAYAATARLGAGLTRAGTDGAHRRRAGRDGGGEPRRLPQPAGTTRCPRRSRGSPRRRTSPTASTPGPTAAFAVPRPLARRERAGPEHQHPDLVLRPRAHERLRHGDRQVLRQRAARGHAAAPLPRRDRLRPRRRRHGPGDLPGRERPLLRRARLRRAPRSCCSAATTGAAPCRPGRCSRRWPRARRCPARCTSSTTPRTPSP